MRVKNKAVTWLVVSTVAFQTGIAYAGDSTSFKFGEFSRKDSFFWSGTYLSDNGFNKAHSERDLQKVIIEETHKEKSCYYKVHAWLSGLSGFPASEEISIGDGTAEAYVELDHWPKVWENDTIVASFPSVKDRPILVMTRGPLDGRHYKYVNVTCYWSTLSKDGGHDGFYIKRRLYRRPDAH